MTKDTDIFPSSNQTAADLFAPMAQEPTWIDQIENVKIRARITPLTDGPFDLPSLFPKTKGLGIQSVIKHRVKLLNQVKGQLGTLLYPDEQVRFITRGTLNSLVEQYFMGLLSMFINRTVFLITNYRVILLNTDRKNRPKTMKWQIPFHQIQKYKNTGLLSFTALFKLKDGKKWKFVHMPRADRKLFQQYIRESMAHVEESGFEFPSFGGRDNLCPSCCSPVESKVYECSECEETFIKPSKPAMLSAMLPCLGDFYLGHRVAGAFELYGYFMTWVIAIGAASAGDAVGIAIAVGVLLFYHTLDTAVTYHTAKKGLIPTSAAWRKQ